MADIVCLYFNLRRMYLRPHKAWEMACRLNAKTHVEDTTLITIANSFKNR